MTPTEFAKRYADQHGGLVGKEVIDEWIDNPAEKDLPPAARTPIKNPDPKVRHWFADGSSVDVQERPDGSLNVTNPQLKPPPAAKAEEKSPYSPERIAQARARRAQADQPQQASGVPGQSRALDVRANAKAFLQDLEDQLALGEITPADANRRYELWEEENVLAPRREAEAARQGLAAAQARHQQSATATAARQRTSEQDRYTRSRDRRQDARADAQEARMAASENRQTAVQAASIGEQAAQRAISQAQAQRPQQEMAAYQAARQSGKDPVAALGEVAKLPPLDLDAIAEQATQRVLARYGLSPTPQPTATPRPAPAAAPASAAPAAQPQLAPAGVGAYEDQLETTLGRFGR